MTTVDLVSSLHQVQPGSAELSSSSVTIAITIGLIMFVMLLAGAGQVVKPVIGIIAELLGIALRLAFAALVIGSIVVVLIVASVR